MSSEAPANCTAPHPARDLLSNLAHPPFSDRRFWMTETAVVVVLLVHLGADLAQDGGVLPIPGFVWILPLLVPVVYGGTAFGLVGSLGAALGGIVVLVPEELFAHHSTFELWDEGGILVMVLVTAVLLGYRFEEEHYLYDRLLLAERARLVSHLEPFSLSWQQLFDALPYAVTLVDAEGVIGYANRPLEALSGYAPDEIVGKCVETLVPSRLRDRHIAERDNLAGKPVNRPYETGLDFFLMRKDGSELEVDIALAPLVVENKSWAIAIVRDDSARVAAEHGRQEAEQRTLEVEASARKTLANSEQRFRLAFEEAPIGMALTGLDGQFLQVNSALCQMVGRSRSEVLRLGAWGLTDPADLDLTRDVLRTCSSVNRFTKRYRHADGHVVIINVTSNLVRDSAGEPSYFVSHFQDVTAERTAAELLAKSEQRFRLAFENNMVGMVFVDISDNIFAVNDSFCQMIGRSRAEIIGKGSAAFTHPEDKNVTSEMHRRLTAGAASQVRYLKRYLHKDGRVIFVEVSKSVARDEAGAVLYFVVSVKDLTEEHAYATQLSHQALHDPLTGLANRALLEYRLSQARGKAAHEGGFGAVLLLDLDDFKAVNDTFGHHIGDQLLVELAHRLEQVTRKSDTLCRFGGDEFLYLATGLASPDGPGAVARRLLSVLDEPFLLAGARLNQRASIGVVTCDASSKSSTESLQNADIAMYEAKRRGKDRFVIFTPDMAERASDGFELLRDLRQALPLSELSMHYQPLVELVTGDVVGFEALMRWYQPERGWVPPEVFIPLAEKNELIFELGSFALSEAAAAASSWQPTDGMGHPPYVSVNLSARQFYDTNLLSTVKEALAATCLSPKRLVLEITESVALVDIATTARVVESLRRLGVAIALDDFGTGYSSLSYLTLLHPSLIKIDRSFVSPGSESPYGKSLLEMIVSLGPRLDMTVLAEGIETAEQLETLRNLGCDLGQGYLFSPAVPASEVKALLGPDRGF